LFHSCSKLFSVTGWRLGWAVGNRELIAARPKVKWCVDTGALHAIQRAGADVLDRAESLVRFAVERFRARIRSASTRRD